MKYRIEIASPKESGVYHIKFFVDDIEVPESKLTEQDAWHIYCLLDTSVNVFRRHKRFPKFD